MVIDKTKKKTRRIGFFATDEQWTRFLLKIDDLGYPSQSHWLAEKVRGVINSE